MAAGASEETVLILDLGASLGFPEKKLKLKTQMFFPSSRSETASSRLALSLGSEREGKKKKSWGIIIWLRGGGGEVG